MMKWNYILIFIVWMVHSAYPQPVLLSPEKLQRAKTYTILANAQDNPLRVYKLDLSFQKRKEFPPKISEFKNLQKLILRRKQQYDSLEKLKPIKQSTH